MIHTPPSPSVMAPSTGNHSGLTPPYPVHLTTGKDLHRAMICLENIALLRQSMPSPLPPPGSVAAMQRLVEIINLLRSTAPGSNAVADSSLPAILLDPEAIFPYVSEEAYEVFDALQQESSSQREGIGLTTPSTTIPPSSWLISVEALIPYLLWCIACSSYRVMQLLEGVNVRQGQAGQPWVPGMVRLIALLETTTANTHECFDLVTGYPPVALLSHDAVIEADERVLPLKQTPSDVTQGYPVEHQLRELQQQIREMAPAIQPFFGGIPVDILLPGQDWQVGEMQLRLEFEFIEGAEAIAQFPLTQSDLVEAELLEDESFVMTTSAKPTKPDPHGIPRAFSVAQVAIVECPRLLNAATLVRLTDQLTLDQFAEATLQQTYGKAIATLPSDWQQIDPDQQLRSIVSKAYAVSRQIPSLMESGFNTLLPELLMDELIPKLLWQITRSSYEAMQLLGGVEAWVLQPGLDWKQGMLRLLAALQIKSSQIDCVIDLASGQLLANGMEQLHPMAVCQRSNFPDPAVASGTLLLWQHPLQANTLLSGLQQHMKTIPEISLLLDGTGIEWLEAERDWQPGTLHLRFALDFTATV